MSILTGIESAISALNSTGDPSAQPKPPKNFGNYNDLFAGLLEFRWRDVAFPVRSMRVSLRQDLVQHKYPDRDAGHIEATGRAPLELHAVIPFLNNLWAGKQETWATTVEGQSGNGLYPYQMRAFSACANRSDGALQHPEFGLINVKCQWAEVVWESDTRDGAVVTASWIESSDDPNGSMAVITSPSPVTTAVGAGQDFDAQLGQLDAKTAALIAANSPSGQVDDRNFTATMQKLQAVVDQATLFQGSVAGQLNRVLYRASSLEDSLDRAGNPKNWPLRQSAERMKAATLAMKGNLGPSKKSKQIALFTMPSDGTIGLAAILTSSYPSDLMTLNPDIVLTGLVPGGTVVRYYQAA